MSPSQVRWHAQRDAELADAISEAEAEANEKVEDALFLTATENRNVTAQLAWLFNREPDRWKDQRGAGREEPMDRDEALKVVGSMLGIAPDKVPDELAKLRKRKRKTA